LSRAQRFSRRGKRGFTMIEVVVALALVATMLASVGSLYAAAFTGARTLEQHVAQVEVARLISVGLPRNLGQASGDLAGEVFGHRWQAAAVPFFGGGAVASGSAWTPQHVILRVRSPSGALLTLETVRLQRQPVR